MVGKQFIPEIRAAAFIAARENSAMSVEELAHLACLSKKQIQQIENGGRNAFYSLEIKYVAAKKVAKLIQLDEKEAFDFGPQAELPLTPVDELAQSELISAEQESLWDLKKEASQADEGNLKEARNKAVSQLEAKPILVEAFKPEPNMRTHFGTREQKSAGKKWLWLLPVGALVLALVQFQPLLEDQLDALMGKSKPVEAIALPSPPTAETAPSNPSPTEASAIPAPVAPASPVTPSTPSPVAALTSGCPPADGEIASYKPPSAGKPGNVVFIRTNSVQSLCVVDADGMVQSKAMEPGIGHSFYGKPPFKLLSSNELGSAEIFFQGFRMRPGTPDMKAMLLVQAD